MDASQLDAVSAVLGAIAASAGAGAGDAVKDMTKSAITGTRDGLVALVRRRLKKDPVGEAKLTVYAAEPTPANGQALHGHLVDAGVGQDPEIEALARELLAAAGPSALGEGSLAASIISMVINDHGTGYQGGYHVHHNYGERATVGQVRWELLRVRKQVFELRNAGDAPALEVAVAAENAISFDPPETHGAWGPGSGREFFAAGAWQTGHPSVTVTWREESGERRTWSRPLPR